MRSDLAEMESEYVEPHERGPHGKVLAEQRAMIFAAEQHAQYEMRRNGAT